MVVKRRIVGKPLSEVSCRSIALRTRLLTTARTVLSGRRIKSRKVTTTNNATLGVLEGLRRSGMSRGLGLAVGVAA